MKLITFIVFLLLLPVFVSAQLIQIEGNYLDKKNNPIDSATIIFLKEGLNQLDTILSNSFGYFYLDIYLTSIKDNLNIGDLLLDTPFPNPFHSYISIPVTVKEKSNLWLHNLQGKKIYNIELTEPGDYLFKWGGLDLSGNPVPKGIYFVVATNSQQKAIQKIVYLGSGNTIVSNISKTTKSHHQKSTLSQDIITFEKDNTSLYELTLETPSVDTSLGIITGNVGPKIITPIVDTLLDEGMPLILNLNEHIYNDDQTIYTSITPGVIINEDSLFFFWIEQGIHPIEVSLTDPNDSQLTSLINFIVTGQNFPPVQLADIPDLQIDEDNQIVIELLEYFFDYDELTYTLANLTNGSFYISNDSLYLLPEENWNGTQSGLVIKADDGDDLIYSNEFSWTIDPVNDPPFATDPFNSTYTVDEDDTLEIVAWQNHYGDVDNLVLAYPILDLVNATSNETDTSRIIIPNPNWYGEITGVGINGYDGEYTATSNTFNIQVISKNDYPNVMDDVTSTPYNTSVTAGVLDNDNDNLDPEGGIDPSTLSIITPPTPEQGIAAVVDGQIEFTPSLGFNGQVTIVYEVYDNGNPAPPLSGQANLVINVGTGNLPPTFDLPDTLYVQENGTVPQELLNLMNSYNDPEGQPGNFTITDQSNPTLALTQVMQDSLLFLTYLQQYTFGTSNITIEADDGANIVTDNMVLKVEDVNTAPYNTGAFDNYNITQGDSVIVNYVRPTKFDDYDLQDYLTYLVNGLGSNGTAYQIGEDILVIKPNADFYGDLLNLSTKATDLQGLFTTSTIFNIYVAQGNQAPDLEIPNQNIPEDETNSVLLNNLDNFVTDPNVGDDWTYEILNETNTELVDLTINNKQLLITYLQPNGFGESYITVKTTDLGGLIDTDVFKLTVNSMNDNPIAQNDNASTNQDEAVSVDVLANDIDPDGNLLPSSVEIVENPTNGQITNINLITGAITYNPNTNWFGTDNFKYRVGDDGTPQGWDTAIVTVDVNQVLGEVFFSIRDITTDLPMSNSTLIIGSNQYNLPTGETSMQVNPQTVEVNAEAIGTWDGLQSWWNAPHYTIIQRPGQLANVEQRAGGANGGDTSSPVTFSGNADTLILYKIPSTVDLWNVFLATAAGPGGETVKYLEENFDSPIWFNTASPNQTPNSTTIDRVNHLKDDLLPDATLGKYNLSLLQWPTSPGGVYCEIFINSNYNPTNVTTWNSNFEVIYSNAAWPSNMGFEDIGTEIIEALFDMSSTVPYFEYTTQIQFTSFGRDCVRLASNFDRGTVIGFTASDKIDKKALEEKVEAEYFSKPSVDNKVDINYINK